MKKTFTLALICVLGSGMAHAEVAGRSILTGSTIACSPFPASPSSSTSDGAVVTCKVLAGVPATSTTNSPAIEPGANLVGKVRGQQVQWSSWTTPDGLNVDVAGKPEPLLVSSLAADGAGALEVVVMHDFKIAAKSEATH